ncbi:MAG: RimK family alpha-L-glutamate ligase [Desulfobacterales bacterium]|nr:RimK family alpha-L-glutamate ligase [Desulfobacterales bacterium]
MPVSKRVIALEARLRGCNNVLTLGVRPNFSDYPSDEADLIRKADKIYYPTTFYADLFDAAGKKTFPSYHTYKSVQDKIKQTALFELLRTPHPRTRVFYGRKRKKSRILERFDFPMIGKIPRGSALGRGVFLIRNPTELDDYLARASPAYIQEYLESDRDIRVVIIGKKVAIAYWRIAPAGEFRTNVAVGGAISLEPPPRAALDLAVRTAAACGWNDVGIDILPHGGRYYVLEGNMKYGREGFRKAGVDYMKFMEAMIENEEI